MRHIGRSGVAVAVILSITSCSKTEDTKPPSSAQSTGRAGAVGTGGAGANLSDADFVRDVALKTMAAGELSRMALGKATNPEVRSFAQTMIGDYGAAGHNLKGVVAGQPIEWPLQLDDRHRETADELRKKEGASFDRDYMKAMVEGHQDLAAKLESRLDIQSVADWKTAAAGRTESKALPEPRIELRDVPVRPNKSGNSVSMKINQWAADAYAVTQKHLDTARTLENATKKR